MKDHISEHDRGVFPIALTPFDEDERIDYASVDSLIDFYTRAGVQGLTLLGILGEPQKLDDVESLQLVKHVLRRTNGRLKVIVGLKTASLSGMRSLALQSMDAGAAGVMISPPSTVRQEEQLLQFFAQVARTIGDETPVVLQDFPRHSGVHISVPMMGKLLTQFPNIRVVKHEEDGGLRKITRLRAQEVEGRRKVAIWVGNSGIHLPQELARGADGANTGIGFTEILVHTCRHFAASEIELAQDLYDAALPVIRHEHQPGIGLAIRKEIYRRRGIIACAKLRAPGPALDSADHAELTALLARFERRLSSFAPVNQLLVAPVQ